MRLRKQSLHPSRKSKRLPRIPRGFDNPKDDQLVRPGRGKRNRDDSAFLQGGIAEVRILTFFQQADEPRVEEDLLALAPVRIDGHDRTA